MLSIFCNHCTFFNNNADTSVFFENYLHYGGIGVEFFLLLSGFLAAYTYKDGTDVKSYIKKRFFRLFPVHLFCLLFFIPLLWYNFSAKGFVSFCMASTLTQSLTPYTWSMFNGASWTISTLWLLYLITPKVVRKLHTIESKKLLISISFFVIGGFVVNHLYYDTNTVTIWFFYISPFYRIITFVEGIILAELVKRHREIYDSFTQNAKTCCEIVVIVLFCAELLLISKHTHFGYNYTLVMLGVIGIFFMGGGNLSKILSNNLLVQASKISFSFYLIHYFVTTIFTDLCVRYLSIEPTVAHLTLLFFVDLFITFVLAILIYTFIEKRFTTYLLNKYTK